MKRRGPYKQYLKDETIPIPATTLRRRLEDVHQNPTPMEQNDINLEENEDPIERVATAISYFDSRQNSAENSVVSQQEAEDDDQEMQDFSDFDSFSPNMNSVSDLDSADEEWPGSPAGENEETEGSDSDSEKSVGADRNIYCDIDENEGEDFVQDNFPRQVLYPGCDITAEESELLIVSFALRFGLSDIALQALIDLVDSHLPTQVHKSVHLLMKKFPEPPTKVTTHFYCPDCKHKITFPDNNVPVVCTCGEASGMKELKRKQSFFLQISLTEQLVRLMEDKTLNAIMENHAQADQSDVHSGRIYRKLVQTDTISEGDVTLQWNTDGVQIFKSSKESLWPIQVAVNNLPFKERRENIMLCGLWLGSKPEMNTLLEAFVDELSALHRDGLDYLCPSSGARKSIKVHTLLASVDSVARPTLQKVKSFRGKFGCSFCLNEGEECVVGRGNARVYPGDITTLRTHQQHLTDTRTVMDMGQVINGVKGTSILLALPVFNIITSFVPDYMHCVLLGVVKSMVMWWRNGTNSKKPFYIGSDARTQEIDNILCSIRPPTEITRTPKSIAECKKWNASEWKHFLLYYSLPIMLGLNFPKKIIEHWFLLVCSMHIFLHEKISPYDFSLASKCIREFVLGLEDVYIERLLMRYNVHLLLHIPKSVQDFGALWAVSCFPYEHYNGLLAKMFKSSQAVPQQICKQYLRLLSLKEKGSNVFSKPNSALLAKNVYESLTIKGLISGNCVAYGKHVRMFGKPNFLTLTLNQKVVIENFLGEPIQDTNVHSFMRFIYKHTLVHVEGYQRLVKRINSVVVLKNHSVISISHALLVKNFMNHSLKLVLLGKRFHPTDDLLCFSRNLNVASDNFCKIMELTQECVAINPAEILSKCVIIKQNERNFYVFPLANSIERD